MPWKECTQMENRIEFIELILRGDLSMAELCRRFGVSRKTGYKWWNRFQEEELLGLEDRCRRPLYSPRKTSERMEKIIIKCRKKYTWGGRKLRRRLKKMGATRTPASSTITDILRRNGLIDPLESKKHAPFVRFEHENPNDLWQMDFKGHFAMKNKKRCFPLTVTDDHSRFNVALRACANEKGETVQSELINVFRCYGLPKRILVDNGNPWGNSSGHSYTRFVVWLFRLGIKVSHSRPRHPQTSGKAERFHRTFEAELLKGRDFRHLKNCQEHFDPWRRIYNSIRPHESLDMDVPASRYKKSERVYPEKLLPVEYSNDYQVRRVGKNGIIDFLGNQYRISSAFAREPLGLKESLVQGLWEVFFCDQEIGKIDLRKKDPKEAFTLKYAPRKNET